MVKIKTFIICNKEKEIKRFDFLIKQINELELNSFLDIYFLDNFTWGDEIEISTIQNLCKTDKSMKKHGRSIKKSPLRPSEISLFLNHIKCLEYANENFNENCLILESDVIFKDNIIINLKKIIEYSNELNDWNIINIGDGHKKHMEKNGYPKSSPQIINNYKFYKENINRCTEAIFWNINSIKTILNLFYKEQDINGPFDTYLDVFSNDPANNFNIYWSEYTIAEQGSINKMFKSFLR